YHHSHHSFPTRRSSDLQKVRSLMDIFRIRSEDLLDRSYIDYLLAQDEHIARTLDVLYSFEGESKVIAEFKRLDVDASEGPEKRRSEEHTSELQSRENLV